MHKADDAAIVMFLEDIQCPLGTGLKFRAFYCKGQFACKAFIRQVLQAGLLHWG